jgi:hypothetical protein
MGLFKEIVCDRSMNGHLLPANIKIIAACNPYRLKKGLSAKEDTMAGLIFDHYAASHLENVGTGITDPLKNLVYRVHPLPESMIDYVFDFGSLNPDTERLYIKAMLRVQLATKAHEEEEVKKMEGKDKGKDGKDGKDKGATDKDKDKAPKSASSSSAGASPAPAGRGGANNPGGGAGGGGGAGRGGANPFGVGAGLQPGPGAGGGRGRGRGRDLNPNYNPDRPAFDPNDPTTWDGHDIPDGFDPNQLTEAQVTYTRLHTAAHMPAHAHPIAHARGIAHKWMCQRRWHWACCVSDRSRFSFCSRVCYSCVFSCRAWLDSVSPARGVLLLSWLSCRPIC